MESEADTGASFRKNGRRFSRHAGYGLGTYLAPATGFNSPPHPRAAPSPGSPSRPPERASTPAARLSPLLEHGVGALGGLQGGVLTIFSDKDAGRTVDIQVRGHDCWSRRTVARISEAVRSGLASRLDRGARVDNLSNRGGVSEYRPAAWASARARRMTFSRPASMAQ